MLLAENSKKMVKIFKILHELNNAEKLKKILPRTIFYEMCNSFSQKKVDKDTIVINDKKNEKKILLKRVYNSVFYREMLKQPFVEHAFDFYDYQEMLPQNQVLMHGIMFHALYNVYVSNFKKSFDNVLLDDLQKNNTRISFAAYKKIPKRYRGVFIKSNADSYILNEPNKDMVMSYNKKNRKKLEQLLLRVKMLLPVIYNVPSAKDTDTTEFLKTYGFSDCVTNSFAAKLVSDEQLNAIHELRNIFMEIALITLPVATQQKEHSGAKCVYFEYLDAQKQKNIFYNTNQAVNTEKNKLQIKLDQENNKHKKRIKYIKESYATLYKDQIEYLRQKTNVKIR